MKTNILKGIKIVGGVVFVLALSGLLHKKGDIDWKGNIVFLNTDDNNRKQIYSDKVEIGLRTDGVIVWREAVIVEEITNAEETKEIPTQEETEAPNS